MIPIEVKRVENSAISIVWDDGFKHTISAKVLRQNCPCATCKEARGDETHAKPLTARKGLLKIIDSTSEESLRLEQIWGIGNYAIGMQWGDNHSSGIYTFELLRELGANETKCNA